MVHRIDELIPLRVLPKTLSAAQYNQIRIGILRLGTPLYLPLDEFPGLAGALDPRVWIVFDENAGGRPVLAWLGFQRPAGAALHLPITCELRAYHMHAGLIMGRALDALERAVEQRLSASWGVEPERPPQLKCPWMD